MKSVHYVILDPTGNLTALVTDPVLPEDEAVVTPALLEVSEQVAYLETPSQPGADAAIRLMGGEFCGNAAMSAAAWLVRNGLPEGGEASLILRVSGTNAPVSCRVRRHREGFRGTVSMPPVLEIGRMDAFGHSLTAVRMEGILHLIGTSPLPGRKEAEDLLRRIAGTVPDEAVGLLQWNRADSRLSPLVFVRGSGSMVWEHGCGSGSAAVGAFEAVRHGEGVTVTDVSQPGGTISVSARVSGASVTELFITGNILIGPEQVLRF